MKRVAKDTASAVCHEAMMPWDQFECKHLHEVEIFKRCTACQEVMPGLRLWRDRQRDIVRSLTFCMCKCLTPACRFGGKDADFRQAIRETRSQYCLARL